VSISPLEIRKHEFRKTMRGYDPDEVAEFLDFISVEMENLVHENVMFAEKVKTYESQLKKYRDIESTLQDTLLSAQRAREDTLSTAKKQADMIIREAEVKISSTLEENRQKIARLKNVFNDIKIQKETYLSKLKTLINSQLDVFEKFSFEEEQVVGKMTSFYDEQDNAGKSAPQEQFFSGKDVFATDEDEDADVNDSLKE